MNLPESILLCLFPNDLVLSRQSAMLSDGGDNDEFEELYGVDVRCPRLSHSLRSFLPPSLTQTVSLSSLRSSNSPLTFFTAPLTPLDSMLRSNSYLRLQSHFVAEPPPVRTT